MIKFFRNIRKSLVNEGKTTNYLKYAIGEIVLVVIGILIALQINNWNENRKNNIAFEKLINSFKEEIKLNIINASNNINRNYLADSVMQRILNHNVDKELVEDSRLKWWISFYTSTIRFSDENLNLLLNQKEDFPSKYEYLIQDMVHLKELIESQKKWENVVLELVMDASKYNDLNLPWLNKNDSLSNAQKRAYILNNPYYHNQLQTFAEIQLDENVYDMNNVRLVSLRLLYGIEDLQKGSNYLNKAEFFKAMAFDNFKKYNCNDSIPILSYKANIRMTIGIFNALKDTVSLKLANENGEQSGIELKIPSNYMYILFRDIKEGSLFFQEQADTCIAKYQNRRNSILLIE